MMTSGKLNLVSVGPGFSEYIVPAAKEALLASDVIVSYELYLNWIKDWIAEKEIITLPLTQEKKRVEIALELARAGRNVALISSGDIGVYGMAPLLFEEMKETEPFDLRVIPGITAATASASLLGAPLSHDFMTLSLSDLLCPWEWIESRAKAAAEADLCMALYNVQSAKRQDGIYKIIDILLSGKSETTACGVVRNAYRPQASVYTSTLGQLRHEKFDMFTCIVIGNRFSKRKGDWIFTPRGYNSWGTKHAEESPQIPQGAFWVFSGTGDGNSLARAISELGVPVVISAAGNYGAEVARQSCPDLPIVSGSLGSEKRLALLQRNRALAVIDATHPYAEKISEQLETISSSLQIPYLRYCRPETEITANDLLHHSSTIEEAVRLAASIGKRIFLCTGTRNLDEYQNVLPEKLNSDIEWIIRLAPDIESIKKALACGIKRKNIIAMQGPFSKELNVALWRDHAVDVVISKNSGDAGGMRGKLEASAATGIPLIVLDRPKARNFSATSFAEIIQFVKSRREEK